MSLLKIEQVTSTDSPKWHCCMEIYRDSFPDWEREPEDAITQRVQQGQYLLLAAIDIQAQVVGFYILDSVAEFNCVMFTFLAVTKSERGKGYGTLLCQDAINRFKNESEIEWLLIEAGERQAAFYGNLGFKKLDLDYKVPKFGEAGSVMMHLMAISAHKDICGVQGNVLTQIIKRMFINDYQLSEHDNRLNEQLALIPEQVKLMD